MTIVLVLKVINNVYIPSKKADSAKDSGVGSSVRRGHVTKDLSLALKKLRRGVLGCQLLYRP